MNTKRKATAAVLFILMLTVVSVGVVVAHHNGLYLNYDSGKQKAQAGKENYAHLWWVQYDANMYTHCTRDITTPLARATVLVRQLWMG